MNYDLIKSLRAMKTIYVKIMPKNIRFTSSCVLSKEEDKNQCIYSHISAIKYTNQSKDMISIPNLGMAQTTKIEYSNPEVLVDTQWVEEHLTILL